MNRCYSHDQRSKLMMRRNVISPMGLVEEIPDDSRAIETSRHIQGHALPLLERRSFIMIRARKEG
jgi:hypothetical protein